MAKKKVSRKELLKSSDEFLSFTGRATEFFQSHLRELKYIGLAIAIAAALYLGASTYFRYVNKKGQAAYNEGYNTITEIMKPEASQDDYKRAGELFEKVIEEHGLSNAARLAFPQAAYVKFINQEYDEAIALYREFLDKLPEEDPYRSLTLLALAACYEAKGEFKSAIETLQLLSKGTDDPFVEMAMFNLARLYRLDNQHDKEKETLQEFIEKFEGSPFLPMAKAFL